jgi:large subunit ribosomal protein L10
MNETKKGASKLRPEKIAIINEVTERLTSADYAFVINHGALRVADLTALRKLVGPQGARVLIAKNTIITKVAQSLKWEDLSGILVGQTALVTGKGDAAAVAKTLVEFIKSHDKAAIKGASLDSKALQAADVKTLAELPSRDVMRGILLATLVAPMSGLVGVFHQKLCTLLYVLKAAADKKGGGEAAA